MAFVKMQSKGGYFNHSYELNASVSLIASSKVCTFLWILHAYNTASSVPTAYKTSMTTSITLSETFPTCPSSSFCNHAGRFSIAKRNQQTWPRSGCGSLLVQNSLPLCAAKQKKHDNGRETTSKLKIKTKPALQSRFQVASKKTEHKLENGVKKKHDLGTITSDVRRHA
jgi:hypothetical protein